MKAIPRIRARVGKISEPQEFKNQWAFEISMWTFDGETQVGELGTFGPYKTEKEAHEKMRLMTQTICESVEHKMTGGISGKYLDLKNGAVMRPWQEQ
jgi:hypothetical protein